jgi:hypothetical protein
MKFMLIATAGLLAVLCSSSTPAEGYTSGYLHHIRAACRAGDRGACAEVGRMTSRHHYAYHHRYHHYPRYSGPYYYR